MTNKNSTCPYYPKCDDETRIYDDGLCLGKEGNYENCGAYPILTKGLDLIKEQVARGTSEKGRNTLALLIEDPRQINGDK